MTMRVTLPLSPNSNTEPGDGPAAAPDELQEPRRRAARRLLVERAGSRFAWKAKAEPTTDTAVALRANR